MGDLRELKKEYMNRTTTALDGMWLTGFVPMAKHFSLYREDKLFGYFCLNDEGYLLQYILDPIHDSQMSKVFKMILETNTSVAGQIKGAFCSTCEPNFISVCLDHFSYHKVNALMYSESKPVQKDEEKLELILLTEEFLDAVVIFVNEAIGAPKEWLSGYYSNLIKRDELYSYLDREKIVAIGECRGFDEYQTQYGDLGVIVSPGERGKGLAAKVLLGLRSIAKDKGLISICSTTLENIGAQKAITRAGFAAGHRIIQFENE